MVVFDHNIFWLSNEIAMLKFMMGKSQLKQEFQKSFGKQVEKLRLAQNLSYRQLAQRCDLDHSIISKIEKGEVNIQLSSIIQLSKGLNRMPRDLFDFKIDLDIE